MIIQDNTNMRSFIQICHHMASANRSVILKHEGIHQFLVELNAISFSICCKLYECEDGEDKGKEMHSNRLHSETLRNIKESLILRVE